MGPYHSINTITMSVEDYLFCTVSQEIVEIGYAYNHSIKMNFDIQPGEYFYMSPLDTPCEWSLCKLESYEFKNGPEFGGPRGIQMNLHVYVTYSNECDGFDTTTNFHSRYEDLSGCMRTINEHREILKTQIDALDTFKLKQLVEQSM
jgi:hypothetical protein